MKNFKKVITSIIATILTVCMLAPALTVSAAAPSVKVFGPSGNDYAVVSGDAFLTTTMYTTKNTFKVKSGSVVRLASTQEFRSAFGIKYRKVAVGQETYYIRSGNLKNACYLSYEAKLVRVTKATGAAQGAASNSKQIVSLPVGSVIQTLGEYERLGDKVYYVIPSFIAGDSVYYVPKDCTSTTIGTKGDLFLPMTVPVTQPDDKTCGGASMAACLKSFGLYKDVKTLWKNAGGNNIYVGGMVKVLNNNLGGSVYTYVSTTNIKTFESAIRKSLCEGRPCIALIHPQKKCGYCFAGNGHFCTISGVYQKKDANGTSTTTYLRIVDSYNAKMGGSNYLDIPMETFFNTMCRNNKTQSGWLIYAK